MCCSGSSLNAIGCQLGNVSSCKRLDAPNKAESDEECCAAAPR